MEINKDNSVIEYTWNKLESVSKMTGLREGISDGRDGNFQKSFDIGYQQGFQNGYMLGKYKGILAAQFSLTNEETNHPLLEKTNMGNCIVCKESEILEKDINEVLNLQSETCFNNEQLLKVHLQESLVKVTVTPI